MAKNIDRQFMEERGFNLKSNQGNANENHGEVPFHTCHIGKN